MNILITAPSLNPEKNISGITTVVNSIIENNKDHRYYHYLLGRPDNSNGRLKWIVQLLKQLVLFPFFVKRNKIELIHENLPFDSKGLLREFVINCWCRILGVPVVLHIHGGEFFTNEPTKAIYRLLASSIFKSCKRILVLSDIEKQALCISYNCGHIVVLPNSINTRLNRDLGERVLSDKPVLLFLGRIQETKGINEIIEAISLLREKMSFKFILCGTGPQKDSMVAACTEIMGADFEYKGVVYDKTKTEILMQSDIFILPSYFEGLPMALLETMAVGIVPVVTDVGSIKSVVQHGLNGVIVNKKDVQDLYEKLIEILSDSDVFRILSTNAQNTIKDKYDIKSYVEQLNSVYNMVVS
jgi:glycosyltransferase involved in cell wall biosynthesis